MEGKKLASVGCVQSTLYKTVLWEDHNTDIAVIPGGLTSIVQPLDVCLNKPFKDHLRSKWSE